MQLQKLLQDICPIESSLDLSFAGISQNSKMIKKDYLFLATKGKTFDARQFMDEAIEKGAKVILAESDQAFYFEKKGDVPIFYISKLNQYVPRIVAKYF